MTRRTRARCISLSANQPEFAEKSASEGAEASVLIRLRLEHFGVSELRRIRQSFALLVCTCLLARPAMSAEGSQALPSVRDYELQAVAAVSGAIADGCSKSYPALKPKFDEAIARFRAQASTILDALLETERFKPLVNVKVTRELVENGAANAQALRSSAATVQQAQCESAISDMAMSDETLRDTLTQLLERQLSLPRDAA